MSSHSHICPSSQTGDEYECVCTYIELERERIIALILKAWPWVMDEELIAVIDGGDK